LLAHARCPNRPRWFSIAISAANGLGILLALGGFALFLFLKVAGGAHGGSAPLLPTVLRSFASPEKFPRSQSTEDLGYMN